MDMSFTNAVLALTNTNKPSLTQPIASTKSFVLDSESLNPNLHKAKTYLTQKRHIETNIIDYLVQRKLLFQDRQSNNIVFPMYDENNNCVGAELQGVTEKRFKGIMKDSKYGYGFNIRFANDNTFNYALFFESAIDLISFIDYKRNIQNKSLDRCILISMADLKMNVVKHTLKTFKCNKVVLCVDNDQAGQKFWDDVDIELDMDIMNGSPDANYKDWNEQLAAVKRRSAPIGRLLVRGIEGNVIASNQELTEPKEQPTIVHSHNHSK